MLETYGFADCFINGDNLDCKTFPHIFKQRLIDTYKQDWHSSVENSSVLDLLQNCKDFLSYELYLDVLPISLKFFFTRIRLSAHSLRVQTGRFGRNRIPRN